MKVGDKIRLITYIFSHESGTEDFTVEYFRHCLGIFQTPQHRVAGKFTPLCELYEPGAYSETKYISNHGEYRTDMVQSWMDLPRD